MFGFGKKRAQYDNDPAQQEFIILILAGAGAGIELRRGRLRHAKAHGTR